MTCRFFLLAFAVVVLPWSVSGQVSEALPAGFHRLSLTVEGLPRTGFYYAPEKAKVASTPVVFVFHGHGGRAVAAARSALKCTRCHAAREGAPLWHACCCRSGGGRTGVGVGTPGSEVQPQGIEPAGSACSGALGQRGAYSGCPHAVVGVPRHAFFLSSSLPAGNNWASGYHQGELVQEEILDMIGGSLTFFFTPHPLLAPSCTWCWAPRWR